MATYALQPRVTSPLRSQSLRPIMKSDPDANLQEQANKLPELWQKFLYSTSYSEKSGSTLVLENIIHNLGVMRSILRAGAAAHPQFQKPYYQVLCEVLQLASLAELHMQNYGSAMRAAGEAERLARQHGFYDLAVASALRRCQIERCLGHSRVMYAQSQKPVNVFAYLRSHLVQSHFCLLVAEAQASVNLPQLEHSSSMQMALNLYPQKPMSDIAHSYMPDYRYTTCCARYHLASGQLDAALADLGVDLRHSEIAGSDFFSAEAQSVLCEIFIEMEDADMSIASTICLAKKARAMGSLLFYSQAQFLHEYLLSASFVRSSQKLAELGNLVVH